MEEFRVRKYLVAASATLAFIITACGSSSAATSTTSGTTCVNASAAHRAYVVVQHLNGTSLQKCVGFDGATIDGKTLMDKSGVTYKTQSFSFGLGMCAIDSEPKTFSECFPKNAPYWSLWVEASGQWSLAPTGFADTKVGDKEALGWRYTQPTDPSPAPPPLAKES
jgi:hypothetical protein